MSGTREGGRLAAETNKRKYGADFYKKTGAMGGKAKNPLKGFGGNRQRASEAGRKGGRISRRVTKDA